MATQVAAQAPQRFMQGIAVPASSVRPEEFFARTRRHITLEGSKFAGLGSQDIFELRKSDILAGLVVKFSGVLTVTPGTGTVASTARWPYDMLRQVRFTANGQSNIINTSGLKLKARDFMKRSDLTDRGVSRVIGGAATTQGTLSNGAENWQVGSNTSALAAVAAQPVELEWFVPVAEDEILLHGAIFAATSSTDLTLTLDYEQASNLFALTGNAAVTLTGTVTVTSIKYSIPLGADGQIVVPDLSTFHSMIQSRVSTGIGNGGNEFRIIGQGAGKTLLRSFYQVWNGSGVGAPLPANATNFGEQAWRYGSGEQPDDYVDGQLLREINERNYNTDIGGSWGFLCHDFAVENAFRDAIDMGTTSELRLFVTIPSGVALTSPAIEYVTETLFAAGAGA